MREVQIAWQVGSIPPIHHSGWWQEDSIFHHPPRFRAIHIHIFNNIDHQERG